MTTTQATIAVCAHRNIENLTYAGLEACKTTGLYKIVTHWDDALISRARSQVASDFYRYRANGDVLLFVDADIMFHPDDAWTVVQAAKATGGIVGAPVAIRSTDTWANVRILPGQPVDFGPNADVQEVQYIGTAFMAIHRKVLQAVIRDLPEVRSIGGKTIWPMFAPICAEDEYLSEDFSFCSRARASGYKTYVAGNVQVAHLGLYPYRIGETQGYPVVIFGGEHGDVPIERKMGAAADAIEVRRE